MAARAVPIIKELGCERDCNVVVLGDALQDVPGHMELLTDGDSLNGADLVLPLAWHDLCIGA